MTVEDEAYEAAVKGRADFREAFRRDREVFRRDRARAEEAIKALNEIHAILDREIEGATQTLAMNLTPEARQSACGWLNAAKGIQIAVTKVWPKDSQQ